MRQYHFETLSLQTIYQPVPVEGALDHDLQLGFVGFEQFADLRQLVAQLCCTTTFSCSSITHT
jgi:hypothetical protein